MNVTLAAIFNGKLYRQVLVSLVICALPSTASFAQTGRVVETESHRFIEIAEGVWHGMGTGSVYTMSNVMVLVGEFDTLVVDSHVTGRAADALLNSIPSISDKPVRYLVNSHYHFDHAHGNQSFPREVEIIGHSYTRAKLNGDIGNVLQENTFKSFSDGVPATVAALEERAAKESNPERKARLEENVRVQRDYRDAIEEVVPTPPNITLEEKMTLFQVVSRGSREIQLLHLGRAHTGGDVVVFLPQERIVFTGDMMLPGLAYMGDGHVDEWPATLEALKQLEFDTILPGHGPAMQGTQQVTNFQAYLVDFWEKVSVMHAAGMSSEETAAQVDMTNHRSAFAQITGPGADPRAVSRIYQLLEN